MWGRKCSVFNAESGIAAKAISAISAGGNTSGYTDTYKLRL